MYDKIKNFDNKYSNTVFLFAMLIIIIFLIYMAVNIRSREKVCKMPEDLVDKNTNYSYKITYSDESRKFDLYVNRYDSKYLIENNDNKSTYYLYYTDFLEKKDNGSFGKMSVSNIIDGVDNKLLLLDYLNDLSINSNYAKINERNCYVNAKNNLTICINIDSSLELSKDNYTMVYTIIDKNNVEDFDVYIDLDYENAEQSVEE